MKKSLIIIISGIFFTSCEKISKSVNDTLKPENDTTAQIKNEETLTFPSGSFDSSATQHIEEAQSSVTTVTEKHMTTHVQIQKEGKNTDFLNNEEKLNKAEEALKKLPQYMGKEIFIYSSISFYEDGRIHVMLQHPKNPEYVDNYEYKNGSWSEPTPEQLSVKDNIKSKLISLQKIPFTNVAKAAAIYNEKILQIEGAKPISNIYVFIQNNSLSWYPTRIDGSRERYSIKLNENGTLKKFERE